MNAAVDEGIEPGEMVQEAKPELGLAVWVDADTGGFLEKSCARIEDH